MIGSQPITLGRGLTIAKWDAIKGRLRADSYNNDWQIAIEGIQSRFEERFIKPADAIRERDQNDSGFPEGRGFAIVALDCLLLESLYGYEKGNHTEARQTRGAFAELLEKKGQFANAFSKGLAGKFAAAVRNGLLHDGETRNGWLIWKGNQGDPITMDLRDGRLVLNRDPFHEAVKASVQEYFDRLRSPTDPSSVDLRIRFMARVNQLCDDSRP